MSECPNGTKAVQMTREQFISEVESILASAGMSIERFAELGRRGELRSDDLRDLWLAAAPFLA